MGNIFHWKFCNAKNFFNICSAQTSNGGPGNQFEPILSFILLHL